MIITIRSKWLLRLAWRRRDVPSYVTARHSLWLMWLTQIPKQLKKVSK